MATWGHALQYKPSTNPAQTDRIGRWRRLRRALLAYSAGASGTVFGCISLEGVVASVFNQPAPHHTEL